MRMGGGEWKVPATRVGWAWAGVAGRVGVDGQVWTGGRGREGVGGGRGLAAAWLRRLRLEVRARGVSQGCACAAAAWLRDCMAAWLRGFVVRLRLRCVCHLRLESRV